MLGSLRPLLLSLLTGSPVHGPVDGVRETLAVEPPDTNAGRWKSFRRGTATFQQTVERITARIFPDTGMVQYMACNDKICLPPHTVPLTLDIPVALWKCDR